MAIGLTGSSGDESEVGDFGRTAGGTGPADGIGGAFMTTLDEGQDALAVVERFNKAWNDHDLEAALGLTTDDCVFEATAPGPDGARAQGRSELATAWQLIFADTSSRFTTEEAFAAGTRVVVRWRYDWSGGHVRGVDVIRVRDGLVAEKLAYVKG